MAGERLSPWDIRIFESVLSGEKASGRIAQALGLSPSYTSECVNRLRGMGLVEVRRAGLSVLVRPARSPSAAALARLLKEGSGLNISKVLTGPGLALLPHLLPPGRTANELIEASALSRMTVMERIRLWRGMGLAVRDPSTGRYSLAPGQRELSDFAAGYSDDRNRRAAAEAAAGAILLWHGPEGFLFSVDAGTPVKGFTPAGPSALGVRIATSRDYYLAGRRRRISHDEALVQTLLVDPGNPRIRRMLRERAAGDAEVRRNMAVLAEKYGMQREMAEALEGLHGKKEIH
jgi:DNA-binding transcriptional ArsR family regulator